MTSSEGKLLADQGRQGTVFCIDCSDYMFQVNENDEEKRTHMLIALKAMRAEMNMKCLSADMREFVGIIFFNTKKTNINAEGLDNIFVYRNLVDFDEKKYMKGLDADAVKQIDELIKDDKKRKEFFEETLAGPGQCIYSQLIWLIQRNFQYDIKAQKKGVFVFTRNKFMSDYSETVMEKVKYQLHEAIDVGIEITHLILGDDEPAEHWDFLETDVVAFDTADKLTAGIKRKNVARRRTTTIPLNFGNGISLAVSVFHLILDQKIETGVYLDEKTLNLVIGKSRYVKQPTINDTMSLSTLIRDEESGTSTTPKEIVDSKKVNKFYQRIGGMDIELDKAEFKKFKQIDDPGLTIIGFKPMKYFKQSHHVGASHFLFPNDDLVNGSACLYRALLSSCLKKNVFILARYILKRNIPPKLVALIPQRKGDPELNETDVENQFYEGFHLIHLPFAEDKRNLQSKMEGHWPAPTDDQVKAAEAFVSKLTTSYNPAKFCNPVLQKHYWVLEALATDNDDYGEDYEFDQIKPYFEQKGQSHRAEEEAREFDNVIR